MFNRDTLLQISSHLDNKTLKILSGTSLWNDIKTFAEASLFWKLRTENLVGRNLDNTSESWKNIYYILEEALQDEDPFSIVDTSSATALKILYSLGYTPEEPGLLSRAVEGGHTETVKFLIDQGINIEEEDEDTFLMTTASENGYIEIVKLLLEDGRLDPSNVIIAASTEGHLEVVRLLLQDERVDPSIPSDYTGELALTRACREGHLEVVRLLLQDKRVDPSSEGGIALNAAAMSGYLEVVKLLLEDPRANSPESINEALVAASREGQVEVMKLLLGDSRIDLSSHGGPALLNASSEGQVEAVKLLLSHHIRATNEMLPSSYYPEVIELLLKSRQVKPNNNTLSLAIEQNNYALISALLKYPSIDPSANKNEALVQAYYKGDMKTMQLLLSDPRVKELDMDELLWIAYKSEREDMINLLLKYGKIDLDKLTRESRFKKLLKLIFPLIRDKALGFYMNRDKKADIPPYYRSLVLLIILRRPSFEDALKWILLHPNQEMIAAARSLISGRIDHRSPLVTAYLGFLLLAVPDMNLEKIKKLLQSEGASETGINFASGLIGAYLGQEYVRQRNFTSEVLFDILK